MREQPHIPEKLLLACLRESYNLNPVTLEFLPRGHDYSAGVYRVVGGQGSAFLLKVASRPLYEPACLVPALLWEQGITSVVVPIPTENGALWAKLADWTVIVYPFIVGDTSLTGMTDEQWKEVGMIFRRIHQAQLPPAGFFSPRKETFDPAGYSWLVREFESQLQHARDSGSASSRALRASWVSHQRTIHEAIDILEKLAAELKAQTLPYVICHADLHPANLIRDASGQVFVIDWDEVMLAPQERDFIFIREPEADAFWDGYGEREIDWPALTYYLWERVVQDAIAYAHDVCFRDDLGEESKADLARKFHETLSREGGNISAAYQASAHLVA